MTAHSYAPATDSFSEQQRRIVEENLRKTVLVHASDIRHDADRFQFRAHPDDAGVRPEDRIEGEFDPLLHGGTLLIYEQKDGKLFVVDGHHRLELAHRSCTDVIFSARVLRERDGVSAEDAKILGAYLNLAKEFSRPGAEPGESALREAAEVFHAVHGGHVHEELLP